MTGDRSRLEWLVAGSAWFGVCVLVPLLGWLSVAALVVLVGWRLGRRWWRS